MKLGYVLSCGHAVLDFSVHSLQPLSSFFFSLLIFRKRKRMYPSSKMQCEDNFLGQNELGKIFIRLNSLEKSGSRKKNRYAVSCYAVTHHLAKFLGEFDDFRSLWLLMTCKTLASSLGGTLGGGGYPIPQYRNTVIP